MRKLMIGALLMLVVMTVLVGVLYPLAMTGLAQLLFRHQANGSQVFRNGKPVGSALIGQNFSSPGYFHGRPSAAGKDGYDATASGGSNLGPTNKALLAAVAERAARVRAENGLTPEAPVPVDLVTASASGLDPHITPEAALLQVPRVAQARHWPEEKVRLLTRKYIEGRQLGVLGEPRVNVLQLNLALDALDTQGR